MTNSYQCNTRELCGPFLARVGRFVEELRQQERTEPAKQGGWCDMPHSCGPTAWALLHETVAAFRDEVCEQCGGEAVRLMAFLHDLVNQRLGKPLHDPGNYSKLAAEVAMTIPSMRAHEKECRRGCDKVPAVHACSAA